MKVELQSMIAASLLLVSPQAVSLGPDGCVSLRQSELGSCVISTSCKGLDTSNFEFAFGCENSGVQGTSLVRHSFGVGGFESTEEFDTQVKCTRCLAPPALAPMVMKQQNSQQLLQKATASRKRQGFLPLFGGPKPAPDAELVSYGPNSCVSTYKSEEGHCILETKCQNIAIDKYNFGLICVDKAGAPVRHNFGKGSFAAAEVFDTLIPCEQCLGTEDIPDSVEMNGRVMTLSKEVMTIDGVLSNISSDLKIISKVVSSVGAPAPAPAQAPALDEEATSPAAELATVKEHEATVATSKKASSAPKAAAPKEVSPVKKAAALVMSVAKAEAVEDSTLDEAEKEAEEAAAAAEAEALAAEQAALKSRQAVKTRASDSAVAVALNKKSTVQVTKSAPVVAAAASTTAALVQAAAPAKQVKVEATTKTAASTTAAVQVVAKKQIAPVADAKKELDKASDDEVLENLLK
jgi:hypothetical protein